MRRAPAVLGLCATLAVIGWAGLRPFDLARPNRVARLGPGLRVEDGGGMALSPGPVRWTADSTAVGLELRFCAEPPRRGADGVILALLGGPVRSLFGIRQEGLDLVVWDLVTNPDGEHWFNDFRLVGVVRAGVVQQLLLGADGLRPRFWVDGAGVEPEGGFGIPFARPGEELEGRLTLGASPPWQAPWRGDLLGLWMYAACPSDADAGRWGDAPGAAPAAAAGLVFAFDGEAGLELPRDYREPEPKLLMLPSAADWSDGWLARDALLNLLGFVPLGFLLVAALPGRRRLLLAAAVLAGGLASLGIELAQTLMVERNSSLLDLVLNTAGTAVGALLAPWRDAGRGGPPG
jgi:hypothetical protein